ncbi:MAG: lysylphosphatidylglycerol synthase transmembrane domain-containing protein [Acidimicrobiales bacterium]
MPLSSDESALSTVSVDEDADEVRSPLSALAALLPWRSRTTRNLLRLVLGVGSMAGVALLALANSDALTDALERFPKIDRSLLALAIALEFFSVVMVAATERRVFGRVGARVSPGSALALAYAQSAIAFSAPGGPVLANAFMYREFRRRGLHHVVVGWVLVTITVVSTVGLTVFSVIGAKGSSSFGLGTLIITVVIVGLLATMIITASAPLLLTPFAMVLLRVSRKIINHPVDPHHTWQRFAARLAAVELRRRDWLVLFGYAVANWAADCACLFLAARALDAPVSFTSIVIAYAAGQAVLSFPLTPGGIGVFEAGVTAALVHAHMTGRDALATVLLYRFISFWAILLIGWSCWLWLHRRRQREYSAFFPVTGVAVEEDRPPQPEESGARTV